MNDPLIEALCQRMGWTLIHFVWQGTAVALVLAAGLALLKRASARRRYAAGCLALTAMAALPVVTFCLLAGSFDEPLPVAEIPMPVPSVVSVSDQVTPMLPVEEIETAHESLRSPSVSIQQATLPAESPFDLMLERSLPYVSLFWLAGVMALCAWHMGGWITLQRFKRTVTSPIDASMFAVFDRLTQQMGIRRAASLYESSRVYVPTVIGWIKPVVLLPASAMSGLSTEQVESILAHELAHIQRQDYLVNILQTLVEILGFYHPAVWWVSHRIRDEREHCCDDLAVKMCGDSMAYARALAHLETTRSQNGALAMAATGGSLTHRIKRLVKAPAPRAGAPMWVSGLILALVLAVVTVWAQSRSTSQPDDPRDQGSKAWTVMRQANSPPLLQGLIPQFAKVLDPNRANDTVWQEEAAGGTLDLMLDVEDDLKGGIFVALFSEATWSSEPAAVRHAAGPGRVKLTGLPLGEFQVAAILGGRALGVQKQWPRPVTIKQGLGTTVHVLVSGDFHREASNHDLARDAADLPGSSDDINQANRLQGQLTGSHGKPVQFAEVVVHEHRPGSDSVIVATPAVNAQGRYHYDGMDGPYQVSVLLYETVPSVFGGRTQQIVFNQVLEGPQTVDFRFGTFPAGTASLKGQALDQAGQPVEGFFVDIGSGLQEGQKELPQARDERYHETFSFRVPFVSEDGTFELGGLPEGRVTVNLTPFELRRYQMAVGKSVVLAHGEAPNVVLELKSKQIYYGRVLFDDGRRATPPGTKFSVHRGDSYSVSLGEIRADGHFKIHFHESQFDKLRSRGIPLRICASSLKGDRAVVGVYPVARLARARATAGEVRIFNPHRRLTPEDIVKKLRDREARINDLLLEFDEEQIVGIPGNGIIERKRRHITLVANDTLFRTRMQAFDPDTQELILDQEYAGDGAVEYFCDRIAGHGTIRAARPEQCRVRQAWAKHYLQSAQREIQVAGSGGFEGNLVGASVAAGLELHMQGMSAGRRLVVLGRRGHSSFDLAPDMNFAVLRIDAGTTASGATAFNHKNSIFNEVADGIWMPLKTESVESQGEVTTTIKIEVKKIGINRGYTADDCRIDFEPGIRVRNLDLDGDGKVSINTDAKMSSGEAGAVRQSLEATMLAQEPEAKPQTPTLQNTENLDEPVSGASAEVHELSTSFPGDLTLGKQGRFGRVTFEDGSPAIISPEPWEGARTQVALVGADEPVGGPYRLAADVEKEGYFKLFLGEDEWQGLEAGEGKRLRVYLPDAQEKKMASVRIFPFELLSKDRTTAGTLKVSRRLPLKLETRIYDISDLVAGPAGSKAQSLEASFFAQGMKAEIDPRSWSCTEGEGTCTVYQGRKLAVLQTRTVHTRIDKYLEGVRLYGGLPEESLLPEGWGLEYKVGGELDGSSAVNASLCVSMIAGQTDENDRCTLRVTRFSGESLLSVSSKDRRDTDTVVPAGKYLLFYDRTWGEHPDKGSTRSGPFLLNLSQSGAYRLSPTKRLGPGQIMGTHEGTYAVNFQSIDRFPVTSGYVYQSPPDAYQIKDLAPGHYFLNAVTQHGDDTVFVRRATVRVVPGEPVRMDLPQLGMGNCSIRGVIRGWRTVGLRENEYRSHYSWNVLIRRSGASDVTTCDAYESLTMDTDYVIRGQNIVQETTKSSRFKATGLLPGKYTVTAIERHPVRGFEIQRQQSKPIVIKDGESVTLDFDL